MAQSLMQIIIEAVDKASGVFKNVATASKGLTTSTDKTAKSMDNATSAILSYAAGFISVGAAIKTASMLWEGAKIGARMESTELAAENLAKGMGSNLNDIVNSIQQASLGTVSEFDAIQSASNAMMLGLGADSQKLGNLMQIAALRGRAMGMTTTQAFSDMVRGIGRLSPMILDNLGIVVDADATFKSYAASIGKAANELTSAEKRQALLNRVLQEGNALLEQAGGLTSNVGTAYERVGAKFTDFTNNFKQNLAYDFLPFITDKAEAIRINEQRMAEALRSGDYQKFSAARQDLAMLQRVFYQAPIGKSQFGIMVEKFKPFIDSIVTVGRVIKTETEPSFTELNYELALQAGLAGKLGDIYDDFDAAMQKAGKNTTKQADAIKNLSESTGKFLYSLSSGVLEGQTSGQISLAFALGQIDDASFNAALAIDKLGTAYKDGAISLTEYINYVKGVQGALNSLTGKTVTVDIIFNYIGYKTGFEKLMETEAFIHRPRAAGGSVMSGTSYLVGERGPEMFVPNQSGQIIPNNQLGMNSVQVLNFTYAPTISTASQSEIEWILKPAIKKVMREYA